MHRLRHPCITTVMGAVVGGRADPEPQLVMELMQHGSLSDLLHNDTLVLEGDLLLRPVHGAALMRCMIITRCDVI